MVTRNKWQWQQQRLTFLGGRTPSLTSERHDGDSGKESEKESEKESRNIYNRGKGGGLLMAETGGWRRVNVRMGGSIAMRFDS